MQCPVCASETRVIDSRASDDGIRRRRECMQHGHRVTTFERVAELEPVVVKRDGRREPFQIDKLLQGIRIAFIKRPVPQRELERIAAAVRLRAVQQSGPETSAGEIGEWTLEHIRALDAVAAFRFASVFHRPDDLEALRRELAALEAAPRGRPDAEGDQPTLPGLNGAGAARAGSSRTLASRPGAGRRAADG